MGLKKKRLKTFVIVTGEGNIIIAADSMAEARELLKKYDHNRPLPRKISYVMELNTKDKGIAFIE